TRIDKIYYREQRDLQEKVQDFNRRITSMNDYGEIIALFTSAVQETLLPSGMHIFLRESANGDFVAYKLNGNTTDIRFTADSPMIAVLEQQENNLIMVE